MFPKSQNKKLLINFTFLSSYHNMLFSLQQRTLSLSYYYNIPRNSPDCNTKTIGNQLATRKLIKC